MRHSTCMVIIAGLVLALSASTSPAAEPIPGIYALKADTGRYLSRCSGCVPGGAYPDSASLHVTTSNGPWAKWSLSKRPNGKWVLQVDTGRYLTRCRNCGPGTYPDSAFVHGTDPNAPYAQWTLSQRPNGKWVLQSDTGRYLTRCRNCFRGGTYPDMVFVHVTDPNGPWAQWDLVPLQVTQAPPPPTQAPTPKPQRGPQEVAAIAQQERAIEALANARRETWPAPRIQSVGDFIVAVGGDHINGFARLGDYWITNYPGDQNGNRSKGRLFSLLQSGAYKATFFDTEGSFPGGMAVLDRDNILVVTYKSATIRFFDYSRGLGGIRELTPWVDPDNNTSLKRVGAAYNTDERVYYLLLSRMLWRGRYGKWEKVGEVDWDSSAGKESIALLYLGWNTFAAFAPGSGDNSDKFQYTIFKVNAKNDFTYISQNVELTMKNPGYTGDGFGANFRWGTSIHTNFSRNTFRMCAAPRRQVAFGDFYCWTSPVVQGTYPITIKTSHTEGAGTDSEIYLSLTGEKGATMETRLNELIAGNAFEKGRTDNVSIVTAHVGRPTQVTLRSDGAGAGADWLPESIQITYGGSKLIANNSSWFKGGNEISLRLLPQTTYTVKVKTGNKTGAGTDANISLTIGTVTTKLNPLGRGNLFEKGDLNTFSITQAQANIGTIQVKSDAKYAGADWYLEYVEINGARYPCNCWFTQAGTKSLRFSR